MSWSFSAVGRPKAVARIARAEAEKVVCAEPEEAIRKNALHTIAAIADATVDEHCVRAEASGSQYTKDGVSQHNQLRLHVEPIYGFVE